MKLVWLRSVAHDLFQNQIYDHQVGPIRSWEIFTWTLAITTQRLQSYTFASKSDIGKRFYYQALLMLKALSDITFAIKSAFDTKSDIGSLRSENDIIIFRSMIFVFIKTITFNILKLYVFMFVTHTACVSTNKNLPSQDFSASVWSVNSCTSRLAYL